VQQVRRLAGVETWLVTIGRVLAAFGLGVLATSRYPGIAGRLGLPLAVAGVACLLIAAVEFRGRSEVRDEGGA
jgi:hypothetical protein